PWQALKTPPVHGAARNLTPPHSSLFLCRRRTRPGDRVKMSNKPNKAAAKSKKTATRPAKATAKPSTRKRPASRAAAVKTAPLPRSLPDAESPQRVSDSDLAAVRARWPVPDATRRAAYESQVSDAEAERLGRETKAVNVRNEAGGWILRI